MRSRVTVKERKEFRRHALKAHKDLRAVACIPDFELATATARAVLPATVLRADAVDNVSRAILLASALQRGGWGDLACAMEDRLHQPYRARLVPGLGAALSAAVKAGAAGAALSGSGPSVFAFVTGNSARQVGEAMKRAFARHRVTSHWLGLNVDHQGVRLERLK